MARDLLPFHTISHNGIKDFLTKYKVVVTADDIPHYKTLSTTALDDVYECVLKAVIRIVSGQKHFALTFDLWTDNYRRRSYITFTFHYLSPNFGMKHFTLETKYLSKSHSASNILTELQDVTQIYNLQMESNFVVTDQGSNIKKAINLGCLNNHFCLGHGLHNLLNVDGYNSVSEIKNLIVKCKSIVRALRFKTHVLRCQADALQNEVLSNIDNLEELLASEDTEWVDYDDDFGPLDDVPLQTYKNINNTNDLRSSLVDKRNVSLKNSVPTRWHSVLAMLHSLGCQRAAINKLLTSSNKIDLILLETEVQLLYKLRDFLQKFKDAVNILSGDLYSSISLALVIRTEIVSILGEAESNEPLSLFEMKNNIKSKLDSRFPISDILVCASLLDPRFSSLDCVLEYCKDQNLTKSDFLLKMFKELIGDVQQASDQQDSLSESPSVSKILKLAQRHSTNTKNSNLEAECHLLLSLSSCQDVLSFWREKASAMPLLSMLARKVLCIPATSTPSERVFSIAGLTITHKRSQLSPHNVNKIVCKENLS
ncbi:zinc finger BED domain-containing protein 4-like [Drosophila obscura]|uniref:zinc finger BED domain-containing protein 4-like n=1 Tax=Drosophila obscura TaxID=7282 RepID=UPI001BB11183|nr:zinc finger BED domain-containing protein 4-like [Drosophila obscura]